MRVFLLLLVLLSACTDKQETIGHFTGVRMTIPYHFQIVLRKEGRPREEVEKIINTTFDEIDNTFNCFNPNSELSHLNNSPANKQIPLSKELSAYLAFTEYWAYLSSGRFDPTIHPLILLWKEARNRNDVPSAEELIAAKGKSGWPHFQKGAGYISKDIDEASIDLSGICKGHLLDLLGERLQNAGFPSFLLDWGGEFVGHGHHPEGRHWQVAIKNPEEGQPPIAIVPLSSCGFATSGSYIQFWEMEGKKYFHIINSKTGYPYEIKENSIISTSVLAPTCSIADAIATTLMTFETREEAEEWLSSLALLFPSLQVWIWLSGEVLFNY